MTAKARARGLERIEQTKEDVAALLAEQYGQGSRIQ